MKIKDLFILIAIYAVLFLLGTVLYITSFHTFILGNVDVFFYRGLMLIFLWGIIMAGIMFLLRLKWRELITIRDILMFFVIFCCVNVVVFTHLPVTADRSITVFMLGHMSDNDTEAFSEEDIEDYFISRYVKDYGAFSKRFHEQEETGTICKEGDKYIITAGGKGLMEIYDWTAKLYNLDDKLIHPDKED